MIEILIALSMFLIVLFAIYSSFEGSRATYAAGEQKADIQQTARIAMELMGADLRLAGFGFPTAGADCTGDAIPDPPIIAATTTSITFCADLTGASTTVLNVDVNPGDTTLNVVDASGIQNGDTIYLINGGQWDQLTVQAVNTAVVPNTITVSDVGGVQCFDSSVPSNPCTLPWVFPWGSQIGRPTLVQYSWAGGTISKDDGEGGGVQPLADNIQLPAPPNTLFEYFDASDAQIGPPWVVATPADIRRITINLAAQSPQGAWRQQNFNIVSDVRPRNL